jgi:tetratricopeptide (TPR) repeat protein
MVEREGAPPPLGARPTGRRLAVLVVLSALPPAQYLLFSPLFQEPGRSVYPLLLLLCFVLVSVGSALAVHRFYRPKSPAGLRLQELTLFGIGGAVGILSLTILAAVGRGGPVSWAVSGTVGFLLLLLASAIQTRMMAKEAGFLAPVIAGLGWPLLVPFQRLVEAVWQTAPWVFSSITFSVLSVLWLIAVLAVYLKSTVPVTMRYLALWVAAIGMMAIVPLHEITGIYANLAYGEVDRSIAFGGLVLGLLAMAFFARQSWRAGTVRKELSRGDELHRQGLHRDAVDHYDRALRFEPEMTDALVRKELALRAAGADREAAITVQKVLNLNPDSEGALNEMGVILRRQGKPKEALTYFEKTLEKNPSFVVAWNNKGNTLQNLRRAQEAIRCYDRALQLNPRFEAAWVNRARALASVGDFRGALESMDRALGIRPDSEAGWNEKGLIYMKMGRYEEALAHFEKALKLSPKLEPAWNNRGNALVKLGRAAEALQSYNRALQLNIDYYAAWYNEGSALIDTGDIQGAIRCLDEAIKLNPASDVAWNERGVALRRLGMLKEAEEHFNRAVQLNPGYAAAWNNRGNSLLDQGRADEAYHCYNIATVIDPGYDKAWYNKGCALLSIGRANDAMRCFEKSVAASLQAVMDAERLQKDAGQARDVSESGAIKGATETKKGEGPNSTVTE